jgi:hypothetical protein
VVVDARFRLTIGNGRKAVIAEAVLPNREGHTHSSRRGQAEAKLRIQVMSLTICHQADIRSDRRHLFQMLDDLPDDGLAETTPLVFRLYAISTTWKNKPPSPITLPIPIIWPSFWMTTPKYVSRSTC